MDASDRLLDTITALDELADELTPDEAIDALDAATLQQFWKQWPHASSWAGALWRKLNAELAPPADFDMGSSE